MNRKHIVLIGLTTLLLTLGWGYGQTLAQAGQRKAAMAPVGTAFTYQGRLVDNGSTANGNYDFEFSLYDDLTAGTQIGSTVAQTLNVSGGLFTTSLDFGADAFDGESRYLEIAVQLSGGGGFTTLTPRQPMSAVPYATYAEKVQPVGNIVVVAKSGGDFATLTDALASITTASASNPFLIKVGPGIYQEIIDVKDYVDIEGSGENITILRGLGGSISPNINGSSATLRASGDLHAEVRWLTVESDGTGNTMAVSIWASGTTENFRLRNITASAANANTTNFGFYNTSSSPLMNNVTAITNNIATGYSVYNISSSSPVMNNVTIIASDGSVNNGIYNISSSPEMNNITVTVSDGSQNHGVYNLSSSAPEMNNVTVTASDGSGNNQGVVNDASTPTMNNVTTIASGGTLSYGVLNNNASATIMNNVTAIATDGSSTNYGVRNISSSPTMNNVTTMGSGGVNSYGVRNTTSSPMMNNVTASGIGGTSSYGVYSDNSSSPVIRNSALTGVTNSIINVSSSSTQLANTLLEGPLSGTSTFTCFNNYDTSFAAVTCP